MKSKWLERWFGVTRDNRPFCHCRPLDDAFEDTDDSIPLLFDCKVFALSQSTNYVFGWNESAKIHIFTAKERVYCLTLTMSSPVRSYATDWLKEFTHTSHQLSQLHINWGQK